MGNSPSIVQTLRSRIEIEPKPAVYISGGLDSTIILHHLREKAPSEPIHTFTMGWTEKNEFCHAAHVAEHYGTIHHELNMDGWLTRFTEFNRGLPLPHYNLQPFFLAEAAKKQNCQTGYCGEGLDEAYGGYWYKPPMGLEEAWADHYVWIKPTWKAAHNRFDMGLEMPFSGLSVKDTSDFYDSKGNKQYLREAYQGILPDFVIERKKNPSSPPYSLYGGRNNLQSYTVMAWLVANT